MPLWDNPEPTKGVECTDLTDHLIPESRFRLQSLIALVGTGPSSMKYSPFSAGAGIPMS